MSGKPLPIIVDEAYERLVQEYRDTDPTKWVVGAAKETEKSVRRHVRVDSEQLEGREAADYLATLIPLAEKETIQLHSAYGRLRWLWYLRRTPAELFEGEYKTTLGYDRSLAEAISWHMPESEVQEDAEAIRYPVDRSVYRRLCQYIGRVKLISSLHIMYRRVGKGAVLDLRGAHLSATNDDASDRAIAIYDQRHEKEQTILGRGYGLSPETFDFEKIKMSAAGKVPPLWFFMPCRPIELPIDWKIPGKHPQKCRIRSRHTPGIIEAQCILDPMDMGENWEQAVLRPYASAIQLSMSLPLFFELHDTALANCLKAGYFVCHEERARSLFDGALPEINELLSDWFPTDAWPKTYSEWRDASLSFSSCAWPLQSGGFLRLVGESRLLIDVVATTIALDKGLGIDRSESRIANIRADLFERQCQQAVDQTAWKPTSDLARLRAKTLRRGGVHLTDIDAIGAVDDVLLCVSCKSLVYDAAYDRGDFNVVQNAKRTVDSAVERWNLLMEDLRLNPQGDNFDFTEYSKIIGVVCTPFVAYTDNADSLREIEPGLRACVSVSEFKAWLNAE